MSLIWKLKRLSVMSPREIAYRAGRDAQRRWEALGIGRARDAVASGTSGAPWLAGKDSYFEAAAYVSAAERILSGRFDVFALSAAPLGFPPSWNRDPKTGIQAPMRFGKSVDYRDDRLVGDIKYLWEPNRHLELVTLAQAWRLTREERFAA
ncbi:MAG: heparinase, partial [Proteobacteria bacterium]|nr:heparinase [Pseudomonadota bacterium]